MNLMIYLCYYGKENKSMKNEHTDNLEAYKPLSPFKFWCQKVLPLVYDDSLSYYELLCKVVEYLNNIINDVNVMNNNINNLYSAYITLKDYVNNYFESLDIQEEINNKLDEMVKTGKLQITPYRYNVINIIGNDLIEKISNAINIGYTYLYVPSGVYQLPKNTVNVTEHLNIKFDKSAVVKPYDDNGNLYPFINCSSNSTLIIDGLHLKGNTHSASYGTSLITGIFTANNSNLTFKNCIFDTLQPYNYKATPKLLTDRKAIILSAIDTSISFTDCKFINVKNYEILNCFRKTASYDDLYATFKRCFFENNSYSFNLKTGKVTIEECTSKNSYHGSTFNAFCKDIVAKNNKETILSDNSFIDTTEGGLFNTKNGYFENNDCNLILFSENLTCINCNHLLFEYTIKVTPTLDPETYRDQPLNLNYLFINCDNIKNAQVNVPEVTANISYVDCLITNNLSSTSSGDNYFTNCIIDLNAGLTGNKKNTFTGCRFKSSQKVIGVTKPIILCGCKADNELTLYKISDTNDEYVISGCFNINKPA